MANTLNVPQQGGMGAELAAAGGDTHGWEGIWKAGLGQGEKFDGSRTSPVIAAKLANGELDVKGKTCLVPGCGRGYDVLAFAEAGATAAIGLELAPTAVERAQEFKASLSLPADLAGRSSFQQGDFFEYGTTRTPGPVDIGFDYTFLCALQPAQREKWAATWAALVAPGGQLVTLVFPIDPARSGGPPFAVTPELYRELLEPVGFEAIYLEAVPGELSHPGREGKEVLGLWRRKAAAAGGPPL